MATEKEIKTEMIPVRRFWFYFRTGNATYTGFLIGTAQFITVEYYLFISKTGIALSLFEFTVLFLGIYFFSGIFLGLLHWRKQSGTDIAVTTLASPFNHRALPGKEVLVYIPIMILQIEDSMAILEGQGKLTPSLRQANLDAIRRLQELKEGKEFR